MMLESETLPKKFVIPIVYCVCFLMAYYGPNADILGNIKFSSWHYREVVDVGKLVANLSLLFAIDFSSGVIAGILLWLFCKINVLKILLELQIELWIIMAIQENWLLNDVSYLLLYSNIKWGTVF